MKVYCMFDNHTFASVTFTDREGLLTRAKELTERKCGASFFVRDESDATLRGMDWHSRDCMDGADAWVRRVMQEYDFRKLMAA